MGFVGVGAASVNAAAIVASSSAVLTGCALLDGAASDALMHSASAASGALKHPIADAASSSVNAKAVVKNPFASKPIAPRSPAV